MALLNQKPFIHRTHPIFWLGCLRNINTLAYTIGSRRADLDNTLSGAALFLCAPDFSHGSLSPRPPIISSRYVRNQVVHHYSGTINADQALLCLWIRL